MKKIYFGLSAFAVVMLSGAAAAQASPSFEPPVIVVHEAENVFTPQGFDDNDNVQVVLYANLQDTCHKAGPVDFRVDDATRTIYLRNQEYFYSGCWCAQVLIPYTQVVNLGVLKQGHYTVAVEKKGGGYSTMAELPVVAAKSPTPDDYLYAPVDHMHFHKATGTSPASVTLDGTFQSSCMKLSSVKVTARANHVIELLPIVDLKTENCVTESHPFSVEVKLDGALPGRNLIHVRSLNGQSLNEVVEL